jgi:hypothetical protein
LSSKPYRRDTFKLSSDPLFLAKVYDVIGLCLNSPEAAVVYCVDEKSQVQALGALPSRRFSMMPEKPEQRTHDYLRHGTTSLIPDDLDMHLVCDNYATHKRPAIRRRLEQHPRFQVHYTPTYSSQINQVERSFAYLTDDLLRRTDHRSVQALEKHIRSWVAE